MASFEHVKVGDVVSRSLGGGKPHDIIVGEIKDGIIYAGNYMVGTTKGEGAWGFRVSNGAEVDEDLGWDGITVTGSFLVKEE